MPPSTYGEFISAANPPTISARQRLARLHTAGAILRRSLAAWLSRRFPWLLAAVLGLLAILNVLQKYGPPAWRVVGGLAVAGVLILVGRLAGLGWNELGLARSTWARGAVYAVVAAIVIAAVYLAAAALPLTRSAFVDARYEMPFGSALTSALLIIPLRTVLVEEIAFRGVLLGLVTRRHGLWWGYLVSFAAFGLWHVLPSLGLDQANAAVAEVAGSSGAARPGIIVGAVVATGLAGILLAELRRRSRSLLAPIGVHCAGNGLAVLMASWVYVS